MIVYCSVAEREMPPISSPTWLGRTDSPYAYLSLPRSMDDIIEWAARQCITQTLISNELAWLSFRGAARYDEATRCWMRGSDYV